MIVSYNIRYVNVCFVTFLVTNVTAFVFRACCFGFEELAGSYMTHFVFAGKQRIAIW